MRYQLRYIRAQRTRSSPGAKHDDSPPEWARTNFLVPSGAPLSAAQQRVLPTRPRVLTFDVIRLLAPVPWLSGRASASHAEGRWFDPSRDHHGRCAGHRIFRYPTSDTSPTTVDLWRNNDGTPSKLATGRRTEGQGRPQGAGKRWRGWYVGDDGKTRTKRFRTEVEAEGWSNAQRGKVVTNQWVSPDLGADAFANLAEQWFRICEASIMAVDAAPDHARRKRSEIRQLCFPSSRNCSRPAIECNLPANRPNAGVWALRTALRSAARPPSARVAVELFCAATDMGQQTFDRAGRLGASAEPDSPKIAAQIDLGDHDFP
jgi:hypothetical protein